MNKNKQDIFVIMKRKSQLDPIWETLWQGQAQLFVENEQKVIRTLDQSTFAMQLSIRNNVLECEYIGQTKTICSFDISKNTSLTMNHDLGEDVFVIVTKNMQIFDHKILVDYQLQQLDIIDEITIVWEIKEKSHESSRN